MINCCHNFEECDCECHTNPGVIHCAPCCSTCPKCNAHIKFGYYDNHVATCGQPIELPVCNSESELCDCEYHQSPVRCHPPCCMVCPHCKLHIKEKMYPKHLESCPANLPKK